MEIKLSHIAIANQTIQTVLDRFKVLGLDMEKIHSVPSEKVNAAMIKVGVSEHFRLELLEPTQSESPIANFLSKRPLGGIHHICFEVTQLTRWLDILNKKGIEVLPPGIRQAARGKALFIHPRSMGGVLVELEELLIQNTAGDSNGRTL